MPVDTEINGNSRRPVMRVVMLLAIMRLFSVLAVLMLVTSCNRAPDLAVSPAAAAYTDGFEVVVFELRDEDPTNVRSLRLKDAELAIAAGSEVLIPGDAGTIQPRASAHLALAFAGLMFPEPSKNRNRDQPPGGDDVGFGFRKDTEEELGSFSACFYAISQRNRRFTHTVYPSQSARWPCHPTATCHREERRLESDYYCPTVG